MNEMSLLKIIGSEPPCFKIKEPVNWKIREWINLQERKGNIR